KRLIGIVLGNQFSRSFPEILQIFFLPPVLQISIGIVPTPLVIKAMGDFMANNRSDASVVYRCISLVIIKRRLQDSRREYDFVPSGIIIGIHCLGSHEPLILINGFAQLLYII